MSLVSSSAHSEHALPRSMERLRELGHIVKPRIASMVISTTGAGYVLGAEESFRWTSAMASVVGVGLVAASATAWNQWLERDTDARMRRTADRPLPSGRLAPFDVAAFGFVTGAAGVLLLALMCNRLAAIAALGTLLSYAFLYTPAKRRSSYCMVIGAFPGAMPLVLGWLAAGRAWDATAWSLFGVMFLWQFPHFLAIAWKYRDDYALAGLRMLPEWSRIVGSTGWLGCAYAVALVPVSLAPWWLGSAGAVFAAGSLTAGCIYLAACIAFACDESPETARRVIATSLVYLPAWTLLLLFDRWLELASPAGMWL